MENLGIGQVSGLAIFGMVVSGLIAFVLPIVLAVIIRKKTKAWIPSLFIGVGVFLAFALILESAFNRIMLSVFKDALTSNILIYALYGGLAAGLFEEFGRFIAMKTVMKKHLRKENSLMYGVGHGGAEAIAMVGITMVSNLVVAAMINSGQIVDTLSVFKGAELETAIKQIAPLWTTPAGDFYLSGVERILSIGLHICLSYLVYRAAKQKKGIFLLTAIALHALVDGLVVLINKLYSVYIAEAACFVMVAAILVATIIMYRKESDTDY